MGPQQQVQDGDLSDHVVDLAEQEEHHVRIDLVRRAREREIARGEDAQVGAVDRERLGVHAAVRELDHGLGPVVADLLASGEGIEGAARERDRHHRGQHAADLAVAGAQPRAGR